MILTKANFTDNFRNLVANEKASHYNKYCFSCSDIRYYQYMRWYLNEVILELKKLGYNPESIVGAIMKEYDYVLLNGPYSGKDELDDDFSLDVTEHAEAFEYINYSEPPSCDDDEDYPF